MEIGVGDQPVTILQTSEKAGQRGLQLGVDGVSSIQHHEFGGGDEGDPGGC